jgi:hypothetical protein
MHALPTIARVARAALLPAAFWLLAQAGAAQRLEMVPGAGVGALRREGGEADLVAAYGAGAVRPVDVYLGEGERTPGTLLFPDDERRRVEIVWSDPAGRRHPAQATLRGTATDWRLPGGLTLGLTLEELERLNGRPFHLAGFAWDGGGIVMSWEDGSLATSLGEGVRVFFEVGEAARQREEFLAVQGDRPFSSGLPALRALAPTVGRIVVMFEQP